MGVDILKQLFYLLKYALLHPIMHFRTYVGSEFWFCVNSHAIRTHSSTAGYNIQMIFSELPLIGHVRRTLTHFFVELSKKEGPMSVCEN